MSAREDVLGRIAQAHRAAPPPVLPYDAITRDYRTSSNAGLAELTKVLVDRLLDYKALVRHCPPAELAVTVAAAVAERGISSLVVPEGLDPAWLTGLTVPVTTDTAQAPTTVSDLDRTGGVITGCAAAVAETGTLVLDGSAGMGRRVISLIPDYHLCVVWPEQIVADVPQAVSGLDLTRPITMISGPSATSDIELNRVEGVHGPRTLEVIIVGR